VGKIDYTKRVAEEVEKARVFLSIRDEVREKAIKLSRDIIKYSGWAITEILKGDLEEAAKYMKDLEESAKSFIEAIGGTVTIARFLAALAAVLAGIGFLVLPPEKRETIDVEDRLFSIGSYAY